MIKFDPPEFPCIETTTALIVNRLFWGFGYNVPEDYLFYFSKDDLKIDNNAELTKEDIQDVLSLVAPPANGLYRSTASLWLSGVFLGPTPDKGVRQDDANDLIPHQERRILRALRVFGAFVNHSDLRIDNTADVYVDEPGNGYVKHYLLDFGEAFGGHGAEHDYLWDGFEHMFSFHNAFENLVTAGLKVADWENLEYLPWKSIGAFEADAFDPKEWKEVYPFEPVRSSQPADNYWAAKILGALNDEHIRTLVHAADYPEPEAEDYMIQTLIKRRNKVVNYFFNQVTPVDVKSFINNELVLKDMEGVLLNDSSWDSNYEIFFKNNNGKNVGKKKIVTAENDIFTIQIPDSLFKKANGYLQISVLKWRENKKSPAAAEFHLRSDENGSPQLVGVVH